MSQSSLSVNNNRKETDLYCEEQDYKSDLESECEFSDNGCEGCYLLNRGMGGENQLAHMHPGGCLYNSHEDYNYDEEEISDKENPLNVNNININQKIKCVICSLEKICLNKVLTTSYICEECDKREERVREIKYQGFVFNGYK